MYTLKLIEPDNWRDNQVAQDFVKRVGQRPYFADAKDSKGRIFQDRTSRMKALKHAYIQPNPPHRVTYLCFDIDTADATHQTLIESGMLPPHLIIQNPENCFAHVVFKLAKPVFMSGNAHKQPISYLAKIERAIKKVLNADKGYSANLIKNPISSHWRAYSVTTAPIEGYTLNELEEHLKQLIDFDEILHQKPANDAGYGRNCTLFDELRHDGYQCTTKDFNALIRHLSPIADNINNRFDVPLPYQEVKHIIRSIARYCSRTDFTESHKAFSELQRARIKKRWGDNTAKQEQAKILKSEGLSVRKIAERLNVSKSTVARWLK